MEERMKAIRFRLRKAMNGVVSASMRQKGVHYKLNFGASLPDIREIAAAYEPDAELATRLWNEDVRELKILATLLYPREAFTQESADGWVREIRHLEIAEQYCANLAQHLPFAGSLAERWVKDEREYVQVSGFILYTRLYSGEGESPDAATLLDEAKKTLNKGVSRAQRVALSALKRYGRRGNTEAQAVLSHFQDYQLAESREKQEFYRDLKFEFEYYN